MSLWGCQDICGYFGKLPSHRDFLKYNVQHKNILYIEQNLFLAYKALCDFLKTDASTILLRMPIRDFAFFSCNGVVFGSIMPSCDAVGRAYPFVLFRQINNKQLAPSPSRLLASYRHNLYLNKLIYNSLLQSKNLSILHNIISNAAYCCERYCWLCDVALYNKVIGKLNIIELFLGNKKSVLLNYSDSSNVFASAISFCDIFYDLFSKEVNLMAVWDEKNCFMLLGAKPSLFQAFSYNFCKDLVFKDLLVLNV